MNGRQLWYPFRKAYNWIFDIEEKLEDAKTKYWVEDREKLLKQIKLTRRLLEDYRMRLGYEEERSKLLNWFIETKLQRPPNVTFVCKHCTFRGKRYHDFCPGCTKDNSGKTPKDYMLISSNNTDSDR